MRLNYAPRQPCGGDPVSYRSSSKMPLLVHVAAILLMATMLFPAALPGQVAGGNLSGTITDPSGRAVPQAQIVIKNVATGVERTVTTNADGFYTAANLLPGDYE